MIGETTTIKVIKSLIGCHQSTFHHFSFYSFSFLRCDQEIKALITARHGESIWFNLARWT